MRSIRAFIHRLWGTFRKARWERDLSAELESTLELHVEENIRDGMSHDEAVREARRTVGPEVLKETYRDRRALPALQGLFKDLHYAIRSLRRSPAFTLTAIATLTLGIGANAIIFSVVDAALIHTLPFPKSDLLMAIWSTNAGRGLDHGQVSVPDFDDWVKLDTGFANIAGFISWTTNLTNIDEPRRLKVDLVTPRFFDALQVLPRLGRTFRPDEDQPGKSGVVVISHGLWRKLGSREDMIGHALTLNGSPTVVIGVMPASFVFPGREAEAWLPLALSAQDRSTREARWMRVIGRLKDGVDVRSANARMETIAERLEQAYPATNRGFRTRLTSLHDEVVGDIRTVILVLQVTVALLLLMGCANLANLSLARGASRAREIAIRASLGAGRRRIVQQLLTESALLTTVGGLTGVSLAALVLTFVRALQLDLVPNLATVSLNTRVLLFSLAASGVVALLFGLAPALYASRGDLQNALKTGGRGATPGVESRRNTLITAQLAVAFLLLVGAGLLIQSLSRLLNQDPGFRTDHILTMRLWLPRSTYPTDARHIEFFSKALDRIRALPGVISAGTVSDLPLSLNQMTFRFDIDKQVRRPEEAPPQAALRPISTGYLDTLGIALLSGRAFNDRDAAGQPAVGIVNESAIKRYHLTLGSRMKLLGTQRWYEIVGVVRDIKHMGLDREEGPVLYLSHPQKELPWLTWGQIAVRTNADPLSYISALKAQIRELDPDLPLSDISLLEDALMRSTTLPRITAVLIGAMSGLAVLMALVGVYGVLAWSMAQRRQEIAIRLALGASGSDLMRRFVGRGMMRVLAGIVCGILGAVWLTRLLTGLLFDIRPRDPLTFIAAAVLLALGSLAALWLPARRAVRIDPGLAIRAD